MNILLLNGSPRKKGNTETLLQVIRQIAQEHGHSCEQIDCNKLKMRGCQSCGGCEKTGRCIVMDDMQAVYEKIDLADRIVLASPIYFYSVSAQLKAVIDRFQAHWCRRYLLKQDAPRCEERKGYLLSVAATKGERIFEGTTLTARYAFDAVGIPYVGAYLVKGMDERGVVGQYEEELERARAFARDMIRS